MKKLALALALLTGCASMQRHPYLTAATINSAVVVGAGICAAECDGVSRGVSDGVLIGELAVTAFFTAVIVEALDQVISK